VLSPIRFDSHLRPLVWGGRRLGDVLHKQLPTQGSYGEAWEISDHASHPSVVADGPWKGRTLRELMAHERRALLGDAADHYSVFPWLVKLLDADDWLSVQVHPNEEDVRRWWPGEGSKTEAWFVLAAAPESRVYAGLLPGVDEQRLRAALAAGTVADCLHQFKSQPGDCLFFPAGTVHAVGGGVLFAEVQQTSDATFRLFDWNRRDAQGQGRKLHIEESLACIDWKRGPVQPIHAVGYPESGNEVSPTTTVRQALVRCRYFGLEYVRQSAPFTLGGLGRLQVALVLYGGGRLDGADGERQLRVGDAWLLPAELPPVACLPDEVLGILLATLP
jgi:mannose-6-phosphate isomerase